MRRTHHKRGEAIPRAFRGEDKKKSASGGTPIVIIAALLGAVYYATRTHPTQHAHAGEIMQLIEAQNRTIAALRGAAARAVAERASIAGATTTPADRPPPSQPAAPSATAPADLAGVRDHSILGLDEATFRATSVAELLKAYAPTLGGGTCERDFGNGLINRWRGERKTYCAPKATGGSQVDCYLVKQSDPVSTSSTSTRAVTETSRRWREGGRRSLEIVPTPPRHRREAKRRDR